MVFIGMDHGTTGISFCIMSDDGEVIDVFKIGREESKQGKVSAIEELSKRVDLNSIDLIAVTGDQGKVGALAALGLYNDVEEAVKVYDKS